MLRNGSPLHQRCERWRLKEARPNGVKRNEGRALNIATLPSARCGRVMPI